MEMNRRDFLKAGAATTFVYAFTVPQKGWAGETAKGMPTHYIEINNIGQYKFVMDKAEMGQGVVTGQVTMFGEEAEINPMHFQIVTAPVDEIYNTGMGMQVTGGSTSTADRFTVLRQAGANLQQIMKEAAAKKLQVPVSELSVENGSITHKSGKAASYGELIEEAKTITLKKDAPLKDKKDFRYIGKVHPNVDAKDKSTGQAQFGIDFSYPDLLIAVVERCPTFGGRVKSFNADEVKKQPGVKDVVQIASGVAIITEKYWQALKARKVLKVEWDLGKNKNLSSDMIRAKYAEMMDKGEGTNMIAAGDVDKAAKDSVDSTVEGEYFLPYLAHSCMEPMNAAAHVQKNKCEIWAANQVPTLIRNQASSLTGISRDNVIVHTTKYLGGGFGRRSATDFALEAIELSDKLNKPIKVMWSREDDTKFSAMRPLTLHRMKAGIKDNKVVYWKHQLGCESIMQYVMPGWFPAMMPSWVPGFIGKAAGGMMGWYMEIAGQAPVTGEGAEIPYNVANLKVNHYAQGLDIPIHFWRSVGHSYNGFVVESFIDELAHATKQDPYKFRRNLLADGSRDQAVLDLAAEKAGWEMPTPVNRYRGIACHKSFNSYVAEVAEIEVVDNQIQVKKVTCAVDCGIAVNPDIIAKQMRSGIIYGLSAALKGAITIENGGVKQANFDTYDPIRMNEAPQIEVHIVNSDKNPTGVGEPGLPPIAAAVGNAVFAATGKRLRELPFSLS